VTKRTSKFPRDPYDWYRETPASVEALFRAIDFRGSLIWDMACGAGNILDVAKRHGHATVGSDIVMRGPRHPFTRGNFLMTERYPTPPDRPLSLVCNPPYGYEEGIAERFIHRALDHVTFCRAAFLLPIEFACSQGRYARLYSKRRPSHVCFLSERPSMPPGAAVEELGSEAYRNGMADYAWFIWTEGGPHRTEALFLPPVGETLPPSDRRVRS
jgi:hypothetical protein